MSTALSRLPALLGRTEDYHTLLDALGQGKSPLALSGLAAVHRSCLAAALRADTHRHNEPMKALLRRCGFTYRGNITILAEPGHDDRRQAFEKILK